MQKKIGLVLLGIALSVIAWQIHIKYSPRTVLTFTTTIPRASGTIIRYEDFKGCKVPIKSDGRGGEYRWIADVPWDRFTIEEKFDMARVNSGYLSEKDIKEIRAKYTKR